MHTGAPSCIQLCTRRTHVDAAVHKYAQARPEARRCIQFYRCAYGCKQVHADAPRCTQMHTVARRCTQTPTDVSSCVKVYTDARRCTQIFSDFPIVHFFLDVFMLKRVISYLFCLYAFDLSCNCFDLFRWCQLCSHYKSQGFFSEASMFHVFDVVFCRRVYLPYDLSFIWVIDPNRVFWCFYLFGWPHLYSTDESLVWIRTFECFRCLHLSFWYVSFSNDLNFIRMIDLNVSYIRFQ